jgi:hypothetical protein
MVYAEPTRVVASPDTPIESFDVVDIRRGLKIRPGRIQATASHQNPSHVRSPRGVE